jgi:site-specific recombinase XerC
VLEARWTIFTFERFLTERKYLLNVSARTIQWYKESLAWLPNAEPTQADILDLVTRMHARGLTSASINCRLRAIAAYCRWASIAVNLPRLKEEQKIWPVYSPQDIRRIATWKPRRFCEHRLQCLLLTLSAKFPDCL